MTNKEGFSLVELLIIILVTTVLLGIVIVTIGPSRNKGKDGEIIRGVNEARGVVEASYDPESAAPYSKAMEDPRFSDISSEISKNGSSLDVSCDAAYTKCAFSASLLADDTKYYCVDTSGKIGTKGGSNGSCPD